MTRYGAILAYDGSAYQGFQRQPAPTPTIQATVEAALAQLSGQPSRIVAAGRTDTGVHALGQVIAFDLDWRHSDADLLRALNARLPLDIALQDLWRQAGFHPRYDALWRQYSYRIAALKARNPLLQRQAWQLPGEKLALGQLQAAAALCLGQHDFAAFGSPPQAGSTNTVRQVHLSRWQKEEQAGATIYTYRIRGSAFLYHMVRRLVGVMAQVGRGRLRPADFARILRSRDIEEAKTLAPPQGLVLEAVGYPPPAESSRETRAMRAAPKMAVGAPLEGKL